MKKGFAVLLSGLVLSIFWCGAAAATPFVEEYSGMQPLSQAENGYRFGFDLWYGNDSYTVETDSRLRLTRDASGAFGTWQSASIHIDFTGYDCAGEIAKLQLVAWDDWRNPRGRFELGAVSFGGSPEDSVFRYTYRLDADQMGVFSSWGWGQLGIGAPWDGKAYGLEGLEGLCITKVAMAVETAPVPEPGTLVLLGAGLTALAGAGRKRLLRRR